MISDTFTLPELGWTNFFQAQLGEDEWTLARPARVVEVQRGLATLLTATGQALLPTQRTGPLAVGDWLLLDGGGGFLRLLDRQSAIGRKAAGTGQARQLIAANVTVMAIVSSCNADFNPGRLERYLVLARQSGVEPLVLLTKADLCDDPGHFAAQARSLDRGVVVETVDATDPATAGRLLPWTGRGQVMVLTGSSGVGKSTLANLLGQAGQVVQGIREDDAHGRHTTTARSMHRLAAGGWLIDTPGMRELALADVAEGIGEVFDDITALEASCRFRDCGHQGEPGCAVAAAIDAGELEPRRLASWLKLRREDRWNSETLAEAHARNRAFGRMHRQIKARGQP